MPRNFSEQITSDSIWSTATPELVASGLTCLRIHAWRTSHFQSRFEALKESVLEEAESQESAKRRKFYEHIRFRGNENQKSKTWLDEGRKFQKMEEAMIIGAEGDDWKNLNGHIWDTRLAVFFRHRLHIIILVAFLKGTKRISCFHFFKLFNYSIHLPRRRLGIGTISASGVFAFIIIIHWVGRIRDWEVCTAFIFWYRTWIAGLEIRRSARTWLIFRWWMLQLVPGNERRPTSWLLGYLADESRIGFESGQVKNLARRLGYSLEQTATRNNNEKWLLPRPPGKEVAFSTSIHLFTAILFHLGYFYTWKKMIRLADLIT